MELLFNWLALLRFCSLFLKASPAIIVVAPMLIKGYEIFLYLYAHYRFRFDIRDPFDSIALPRLV